MSGATTRPDRRAVLGPWAAMPLGLVSAPGVTLNMVRVYTAIAYHQGSHESAWPSVARISEVSGVARGHVSEAISRLESTGWIILRRRFGQSTVYRCTHPVEEIVAVSPETGETEELGHFEPYETAENESSPVSPETGETENLSSFPGNRGDSFPGNRGTNSPIELSKKNKNKNAGPTKTAPSQCDATVADEENPHNNPKTARSKTPDADASANLSTTKDSPHPNTNSGKRSNSGQEKRPGAPFELVSAFYERAELPMPTGKKEFGQAKQIVDRFGQNSCRSALERYWGRDWWFSKEGRSFGGFVAHVEDLLTVNGSASTSTFNRMRDRAREEARRGTA